MAPLCTDMANQHAAREAQELAQHADCEAREDCWDAQHTFENRFSVPKTKALMRLLNVASEDDLPETLQALGRNKKKSDDIHISLGAIDERSSSLASAANEDTKPQQSTHIIDKFQNFTWAATGNDITDVWALTLSDDQLRINRGQIARCNKVVTSNH